MVAWGRELKQEKGDADSEDEGLVGWLVGCFGFNGPLRQYCSLHVYRAVSQREVD